MDELMHYGIPRRSGRYPWGSGDNPRQGTRAYYDNEGVGKTPRHTGKYPEFDKDNPQRYENARKRYDELKDAGYSEAKAAEKMGMTVPRMKAMLSIEFNERMKKNIESAEKLRAEGKTNWAIAKEMGVKNESIIRSWLKKEYKQDPVQTTADILRKQVAEKKYIDVGGSSNLSINVNGKPVSGSRLSTALEVLKDEGYTVTNVQVPGTDPKKKTTIKVLAPPGSTYKEINANQLGIKTIDNYISDNPDSIKEKSGTGLPRIKSVDRDRIMVRYDEDGGSDKDGVIELRRGVRDLSLGSAGYAQVRIAVDDKYYMKGMAVYTDDMPPGVDIIYNSNKKKGAPDEKVFKHLERTKDGEIDYENPFKSAVKTEDMLKKVPRYYTDENGKQQTSPINVVNEEGDWKEWSRTISAQMLSKQPLQLVTKQLGRSTEIKRMQLAEINSIDNPVVKRKFLENFARECDATAVHLKAVAFPHQAAHVLLPLPDIPSDKIYAPNYKDGTKVALIRYPHAGTFEIPVLTVDNTLPSGKKLIGPNSPDAIGIHPKAEIQLSGADNDGDTAVVIPFSDDIHIESKPYLKDLIGFDPKKAYSIDRTDPQQNKIKKITEGTKQKEMGVTTNLILDMTVKRAPDEDMAKVVKHSMVIIDALKHDLDYRRSYRENEIQRLKDTYQIQPDGSTGGATTLLTRARNQTWVDTKVARGIDKETGKIIYEDRPQDSFLDKRTGEIIHKKEKSTQMADTDDARTLISPFNTSIERAYAKYANDMKALGNEARRIMVNTETPKADPAAAKAYATEVASLNAQLLIAEKNRPKERQARIRADEEVRKAREMYENMKEGGKEERRIRAQALNKARNEIGAHRREVQFSEKEWEAVQARAISPTKLAKLLNNADMDKVRDLAMPKTSRGLSPAKEARIKAFARKEGMTIADIAEMLGVSETTVQNVLKD